MLFNRRDIARLAGISTATVLYVINDVLCSVTQETPRSVMRAVEERHNLPVAIERSLVTKTDFNRFQQSSSVSSIRTFPGRFTRDGQGYRGSSGSGGLQPLYREMRRVT